MSQVCSAPEQIRRLRPRTIDPKRLGKCIWSSSIGFFFNGFIRDASRVGKKQMLIYIIYSIYTIYTYICFHVARYTGSFNKVISNKRARLVWEAVGNQVCNEL